MYACVCNALTENDVQDAIVRGARSVSQVFAMSGSRAQCGVCSCHVRDMIRGQTLAMEAGTETSAVALESGHMELTPEPA